MVQPLGAGFVVLMMDTRSAGICIDPQFCAHAPASSHMGHDWLAVKIVESHRGARVPLLVANLKLEKQMRDTPLIGCIKFRLSFR